MCGIAGSIADTNAVDIVVSALRVLEYRGYDSAGIGLVQEGRIQAFKEVGALSALASSLPGDLRAQGAVIGHTRWATHGMATRENAHPHVAGRVGIVHNGIIENADELRRELEAGGRRFRSSTDTEVVAVLLDALLEEGLAPIDAWRQTLSRLAGDYAIVALVADLSDRLFLARKGAPLVVGLGSAGPAVSSDILALPSGTDSVICLEDGDHGFLARDGLSLFDAHGRTVTRPAEPMIARSLALALDRRAGHMQTEILEQPAVISRLASLPDAEILDALSGIDPAAVRRVFLVGCGTAHYACLASRGWLRDFAGLPSDAEIASESDPAFIGPEDLVVAVSQSGETADTLLAVRRARERGAKVISVVNTPRSSLERLSDGTLDIQAGPEIGVASTKAFTAQMAMLLRLALAIGHARERTPTSRQAEIRQALLELPQLMADYLEHHRIEAHAAMLDGARSAIFLGRGPMVPLAREGALKLKECTYIHAEAYPAGELKHGPIALIEEGFPVVCLAFNDSRLAETLSSIEEVRARGADVLAIGDAPKLPGGVRHERLPSTHPALRPFLASLPLQLLALTVAEKRGLDPDRPRNLAKSVTVR